MYQRFFAPSDRSLPVDKIDRAALLSILAELAGWPP
jgi:hypothetical protein